MKANLTCHSSSVETTEGTGSYDARGCRVSEAHSLNPTNKTTMFWTQTEEVTHQTTGKNKSDHLKTGLIKPHREVCVGTIFL